MTIHVKVFFQLTFYLILKVFFCCCSALRDIFFVYKHDTDSQCIYCRQKYNRHRVLAQIPSSVHRPIMPTSRSWICLVQQRLKIRYIFRFFFIWLEIVCLRFHSNRISLQQLSQKASDDLLQLAGNPFANMFGTPQPGAPAGQSAGQNNMWMTNGTGEQSI